jgi:16S rRNA (cytosine967-C5)-methyltransferase
MALDTRTAAAQVIGEVLAGKSLNQVLTPRLLKVAERDRGLLQQLCYGSLRQAPRLQALLEQLLDKPLRDKDRDVQGLLICGLYQLESTRIPDHAAVAATVGAVRGLKKNWAKNMTNAVLRRFLRERDKLEQGLDEAARANHPRWLFREISRQWPEAAGQIMDANNLQPPMTLRVNRLQTTREAYLAMLANAGIAARAGALCEDAIYLEQPCDVAELPGFTQGQVSVQDEAAQLAALLLEAAPGERILDACSAPGGKTCHILELQPAIAELVAMDIDETRLLKVSENLGRLGLTATLLAADAGHLPMQLEPASFDRILVDAPCSATGVIRRHPDVKLLRREEDIHGFAAQQRRILDGLWPLLKAGGTLLYATCSILAEENSAVLQKFLSEYPDAELVPFTGDWGQQTPYGRQLLPSPTGPDGLFYARLRKTY